MTGIITIITLLVVYHATYTFLEPIAYDFMTKYVVTKSLPFDNNKVTIGNKDIVLIVVDDKTIQRHQWPWKREKWCSIYNYLSEYAKPKVIGYDGLIVNLDKENPDSDKR